MSTVALAEPAPPQVYGFTAQLDKGQAHEAVLDKFYARQYVIQEVNRDLQRMGIDRIFQHKRTALRLSVEYKADERAAKTGNVFVETVSVDTVDKKGWALTSLAQVLVYYVPPTNTIYQVGMLKIKRALEAWKGLYQTRTIPNIGYNTIGLLVPLQVFEKHCQVLKISG
jgi:hypothetical protein